MSLRIWCAQVKNNPINIKKLSETTPAFAILSKEPTYDIPPPRHCVHLIAGQGKDMLELIS
jgi:hypothetical protein